MPIETNLNTSPYFDDYDQLKDFYRVLFRPGVSLQARELTQLQTILQQQIERFGDHVFKSGTIVSGCNFQFNSRLDYVKVLDNDVNGLPITPSEYKGLFIKNSANLVARVVDYKIGFQARDPETNYLFLRYINGGNTNNLLAYSNSDVLTVYSDDFKLFDFDINNGGSSFSNTDSVQITSALVVANSTLVSGAGVSQTIGANTANVFVIESNTSFGSITVNGTTFTSADGYSILKIKPITADLANTSLNSSKWTVLSGYSLVQGSNTANVVAVIGSSATATLATDGSGLINDINLTNSGSGYEILPYVTVRSSTGVLSTLDIVARNYKAQVTVADGTYTASNTTPVGYAYAFSVTEGIIYQKGLFLRSDSQSIVVNAYSTNVDSTTVGFVSAESVVNSSIDDTLLDNATGTFNYAAPGAHRLKLVPQLVVVPTSNVAANNTFFPLVEFAEGAPFKQNKNTAYNILAQEFERRTDEASGSFVIDPFVITTRDKQGNNYSNSHVDVVIDPGLAYISGKRVQTDKNTYVSLRRANDTKIAEDEIISINYGSYVMVDEFAGYFDFKSGAQVDLYNAARDYITTAQTTIAATGTKIGTARIRSMVFDSGIPGANTAKYRMYLFDTNLYQGRTFKDVRSIHFSNSNPGICDIVLDDDPATGLQVALLKDTKFSSLVFQTGNKALKQANSVDYTYRTSNTSATISTIGTVSITVGDTISYGNNATVNSIQRRDIILTPKSAVSSTNAITNGTLTNLDDVISAPNLATRFNVGDFVEVTHGSNTAQTMISQLVNIANSTHATMKDIWNYTTSSGDATIARHFPAYVPIPLDDDRAAANTNSTGKTLTVTLSNTANQTSFSSPVDAIITFNIKKVASEELHKNVDRSILVKLDLANHPSGVNGPWCLGVPDVFRLNRVFVGANSSVNTSSSEITRYFYIDNGQKDDYYGLANLAKLNNGNPGLSGSNWLLVEFDTLTLDSPTDAGFFSIESYDLSNNNEIRANLADIAMNIVEIPEFRTSKGEVIDLRDAIDFRPRATPTANVTADIALATTNPANTISFSTHDKLFPLPDSEFQFTYEYFLRRVDRLIIDTNGDIRILEGVPATAKVAPPDPLPDTLTLSLIDIPPYPSIPKVPLSTLVEFGTKKVGTEAPIHYKVTNYTITTTSGNNFFTYQPKRFTMADINKLERRIEDLEYYTNLNLLEKKTKDLVIPSGNDPSINRFKNGFFVDNFNDYLQVDTLSPDYTACVDQEQSALCPPGTTRNFQCRFNYNDTTTRNNARTEEDDLGEPGTGVFGEAVVMLPLANTVNVITQEKFTSAVSGDGTDTRFVGDMIVKPAKFKVLLNAEVRITGPDAGPAPANNDDCSIICQKLYQLGYYSEELNRADQRFGAWFRYNYPVAYRGYIYWATTVVEAISKNLPRKFLPVNPTFADKFISSLILMYCNVMAKPWAEEMASRINSNIKPNLVGKYVLYTGWLICELIGRINPELKKTTLLKGYTTFIIGTFFFLTTLGVHAVAKPISWCAPLINTVKNKVTKFIKRLKWQEQ